MTTRRASVRWERCVGDDVAKQRMRAGRWIATVDRCDWTDDTHSWIAMVGDGSWHCRAEYATERAAKRAAVALARRLAGK